MLNPKSKSTPTPVYKTGIFSCSHQPIARDNIIKNLELITGFICKKVLESVGFVDIIVFHQRSGII
jgi:hypothetical protein